MKNLTPILSMLLVAAIGYIIYLHTSHPAPAPPPTAKDTVTDTKKPPAPQSDMLLQYVIHLDDAVSSMERYYNLFDDAVLQRLFVGNISPSSDTAKMITKELGLPLHASKDPFPRAKIEEIFKRYPGNEFVHFGTVLMGNDSLNFGSTKSTPCAYPSGETVGQVIPWFKVKDPRATYDKAIAGLSEGIRFDSCGAYIKTSERNEGYVIDPQGFVVLFDQGK